MVLVSKINMSTLFGSRIMSTKYELPGDFHDTLISKYEDAIANDHIKFNGKSAVNEIIHELTDGAKIDFQLTLLESLEHRPEKGDKELNPFEKPEPELTVVSNYGRQDELKLVYNKFPVVPYHFLMVTKEFISQNTPLSSSELMSMYTILKSLEHNHEDEWFSFFNCGNESGASQPHKHVQFMTLPKNFVPYPQRLAMNSEPFIPTAKSEPLQNPNLPFAHFVARLPESDFDEDDLSMYFAALLQRTMTVLRDNGANHISYNFIMTTNYMLMVPRSHSHYKNLGINSCGVLGLILCKNKDLFSMVKQDGAINVLKDVCFPSTAGQKSDEYDY